MTDNPTAGAAAVAAGGSTPPGQIIALEQVQKRYGVFRPVLVDIDLAVRPGECVVVHGAAGCGRSVLLRLLAGRERPSAGVVRIAGEDAARLRPRPLALLRRSMGVLPADDALLSERTALQNVELAAHIAGAPADEAQRRARAALALLGVEDAIPASVPCGLLSTAQRRCVALARALVNRPAMLLLDDPLDVLDEAMRERALQVLAQFNAAGVTLVCAVRGGSAVIAGWPSTARHLQLRDGRLAP